MRADLAVDQYGQHYPLETPHARKELLGMLCRSHCDKMYCDTTDGEVYHVGYIIGGLWLTLYHVEPVRVRV